VLKETSTDPLREFLTVNRDGTLRLAAQASAAGVKRLVFLSSVGVMGLHTNSRAPFTVFDRAAPVWDYAVSKFEAERGLALQGKETGLEVVVVRPPMVYGPEVPANFLRLLRIVDRGLPLPFASVVNRRSMVYLDNLLDLLTCCVLHPAAAGKTFMVSDGCDVSTPDLVRKLAELMGRPARMVPFPVPILRWAGQLIGRKHDIERLVGSLQVDIQYTCQTLGWSPPVSLEAGLRETVNWYLASRSPARALKP
jgi:nucleoside-diphosphate-sugar epimerase